MYGDKPNRKKPRNLDNNKNSLNSIIIIIQFSLLSFMYRLNSYKASLGTAQWENYATEKSVRMRSTRETILMNNKRVLMTPTRF
jgi:hypothetical protein